MPKVKVNDLEMFYIESGQGEPLVLIHGLGGDHREWAMQIPVFAQKFRVIALDLRGHGETDKIGEKYSLPTFAKDVIGLLDKLEIDKAYFCGVSMGGIVTLQIALNYPERVKGLILVNTTARLTEQAAKVVLRWVELFQTKGFDAYFDQVIKDAFHPSFIEANPELIKQIKEMSRNRDFQTVIKAAFGLQSFNFVDQLEKINAPTLIIHGEDDKVIPVEEAKLLHQKIPNSELIIFPRCGHATIIEKAQEFNKTVIEFLEKQK